jgi:hypothetical protein
VFGFDNFVPSDLIPCINLKKLVLGGETTGAVVVTGLDTPSPGPNFPDHPVQLKEFISHSLAEGTAAMDICKTLRPDGQPIIDFGSLMKITFKVQDNNTEVSQQLFRRCEHLNEVHISCKSHPFHPLNFYFKHVQHLTLNSI